MIYDIFAVNYILAPSILSNRTVVLLSLSRDSRLCVKKRGASVAARIQ